ncbi:MAG: DUF805 domain-containing protein [Halieaceae bacterium]|nr:DUF805 domain-containing protein [Halieaceae bacterium]
MCTLVLMLLSVLLGVLDAILFGAEASATQFLTLSNAFALITFIPSLTVSVRRLHDIDKMWMVATDLPGGYWCFFNPLLELCC